EPSWLSWAAPLTTAALAVAVAVVGIRVLRGSAWLSGIGPQAVVALGGVAVSVYGLWGFATETIGLPEPLAVAFIGVFDAAEMTLLVMLYRAADPDVGWTRQLRMMHRTAWTLVAFSGAMNAAHAPNLVSMPVLAAVPALAAWLIELQLRHKLGAAGPEDDPSSRPGPARLLALIWQHGWAALFAVLGLDARSEGDTIARAALAHGAARRVYRLRLALEAKDSGKRFPRVSRRRIAAQRVLGRAEIAADEDQAMTMSRHMASLTGVDTVARLDYSDPEAVVTMVEKLAITPAAQHLAAGGRAAEAEAARQRAESARQEAEAARQRAEDELTAAQTALTNAREEAERVLADRDAALADREEADSAVADARQRAEDARQEAEAARQRAESARQKAEDARKEEEDALADARQEVADQRVLLATLQGEADVHKDALAQLTGQIQEAETLRDRLRGDLADLTPETPSGAADGQPMWRSAAKQQGWERYTYILTRSGGTTEPTAADLADRFGIDAGNARNWLRDFRAARAAQLAAREPRAAARPPRTAEQAELTNA
ncbi:ATP synthase F0 subunit B, partial [Streptomyces benahoarensis]|uniref:ATP synthase F0 subunit B n=1 Tax=Streptomyces benahoarensis TaxID=2595054 RepID=UPI00163D3E7D